VNDRTVRRLSALTQSASTARVLNLVAVHRKLPDDADLAASPMFRNPILDQSIIVKHRLRPHEQEMFPSPRPTATKVMLPIDKGDLKHGARYLFVGQKDFDQVAQATFGDALKPGALDRQVMDLIDALPSLDPFLLREHLKRHGFEPARAYFNLSDADIGRMCEFVRLELMALVSLSFADGYGAPAYASRLVEKLLSNNPDADLEPLRQVLKLSDQEYLDGIFSWRGFLYYKWVLQDLIPVLAQVLVDIELLRPRGARDPEASAYLPAARVRIQGTITQTCESVKNMLSVYDRAYASLTQDSQPAAFREFLLTAPDMFTKLGEELGAIQHVVSFWRYRFPKGQADLIASDELMDMLLDFEDSMTFGREAQTRAA